jgi:hypothetical protein
MLLGFFLSEGFEMDFAARGFGARVELRFAPSFFPLVAAVFELFDGLFKPTARYYE